VLKSIVWKVTGQPHKGLVFASRVGQLLGWTAIAVGGASVLGLSSVGSVWTLLIGLFLLQNANRTAQFGEVQGRLTGLTAADAVAQDSPIIEANVSLRDFAENALLAAPSAWRKFLVADETGLLVGTVLVDALKQVPRDQWDTTTVATIMESAGDILTVGAEQPLMEVVKTLETQKIQALAVIDNDGSLAGLLEKRSIQALLQSPQAA
jgi:CBS domain-containing protein